MAIREKKSLLDGDSSSQRAAVAYSDQQQIPDSNSRNIIGSDHREQLSYKRKTAAIREQKQLSGRIADIGKERRLSVSKKKLESIFNYERTRSAITDQHQLSESNSSLLGKITAKGEER